MLSLDQVWAVIQRITYKPGWKVILDTSPLSNHWQFVVSAKVSEVDTGEPTKVTFVRDTDLEFYSEGEVVRVVHSIIEDLEAHETKEWLKVDGKNYLDPHPELRGRA